MASLPFSTGLHSVLSCFEASPTRTVAFLCLLGQLHQPLHQGWLLETFLSQSYIHLMWSRPVSWTLTEAGKQEESPCCGNWSLTARLFRIIINQIPTHTCTHSHMAHYKLTYVLKHGGTHVLWASVELILTFVTVKCDKHPCQSAALQADTTLFLVTMTMTFFFLVLMERFNPSDRPLLLVYTTPKVAVVLFIQKSFHQRKKRNLYLWPRQWHKNRFKPFSICLQSQCNAIITCFHGPGHIWLALQKKKKKIEITQGAFFLPSLCALLYFSIWLIFLK